ncbi:MTH1187 family thiamine-binding protein [Desulfogranum marinum]|uniref:MTH1187 family thiamine-binding protein n=1 Tax=Desulfogranum marinum TaxID=453220 RepID=UPI0029C8A94E|nr:MTH1187 family thiamine-binding protein [Desulfogranum marinum]
MLASFAILPCGVGQELKEHVAAVVKLVADSGLEYKLGAMQTTIEGEQSDVMELIMKCHNLMMERAPRVLTSITLDDRKGATGRMEGKVADVEAVLQRWVSHE